MNISNNIEDLPVLKKCVAKTLFFFALLLKWHKNCNVTNHNLLYEAVKKNNIDASIASG